VSPEQFAISRCEGLGLFRVDGEPRVFPYDGLWLFVAGRSASATLPRKQSLPVEATLDVRELPEIVPLAW
jgi:hypothetical protein